MPHLPDNKDHENPFPGWMSARAITERAGITMTALRTALNRADEGKGCAPPRTDPRFNFIPVTHYTIWRKAVLTSPHVARPDYQPVDNPFAAYLTSAQVALDNDTTAKRIGDAMDRHVKATGADIPGTMSFGGHRLLRKGAWETYLASKPVPVPKWSRAEALAEITADHDTDGVIDIPGVVADPRSAEFTAQELGDAVGRTRQAIHNVRVKLGLRGVATPHRHTMSDAVRRAEGFRAAVNDAGTRVTPAQIRAEARAARDKARAASKAAGAADRARRRAETKALRDATKDENAAEAAKARAIVREARRKAVLDLVDRGFTSAEIAAHLGITVNAVGNDRRKPRA